MRSAEELVHISGDVDHGIGIGYDLRKTALVVKMRYEGRYCDNFKAKVVEMEVYKADGGLMVHSMCVKCGKSIRITSDNKRIDYDKDRGLFVEPFTCAWELGGKEDRQEFGLGLCSARVAYDGKVIKDA